MKDRLLYLDCMKGIGIILMVLGHLDISNSIFKHWFYCFHMPLFFMVSGVIWALKDNAKGLSVSSLLKKRIFQLGVPYFAFCLIKIAFYLFLSIIAHENFDWHELLKQTFLLRGIGALWFLPCFFISEILLLLSIKTKNTLVIFVLLIFATTYSLFSYTEMTHLGINVLARGMLGFLIAWIGYIWGKYKPFELNNTFILLFISTGTIIGLLHDQVDMCTLQLNNILFYFLALTLINTGLISIFQKYENRWKTVLLHLSFWGANSIIVLCTHNILIEILRLIDYKLFDDRLKMLGFSGSLVLAAIVLLLEIPIIYLGNQKFYLLFGKKHQ